MNYENTRVYVCKPRFRLGQKSQEVNFVMGVDTLRNRDTVRPSVNQTRLGNEVKSLIKPRTHALNGSWKLIRLMFARQSSDRTSSQSTSQSHRNCIIRSST